MQRAGPLAPIPALLAELGTPLAAVLEGTGVLPEDLRHGAFVPYTAAVAILERAAVLTGLEDFGLRLGLRQTLASLGPIATVMRHAASLGEALQDFVRFQIGNSTGAACYLQKTALDVAFGYYTYRVAGQASRQLHDLVIATAVRLIDELTNQQARIEEIHLIRPRPASVQGYQALGGAPILFGQSQTCILLSETALSLALPEANPAKRKAGLFSIQQMINRAPFSFRQRVHHTIGPKLCSGQCALADIARELDLHPRRLQRLLCDEGTTFEAIRDDVRHAAARDLLAMTQLSILEIALSLGYSTQSTFIHAFQRWSGTTPARWRNQMRDQDGPP
jgi:AraC-like DNA-binding protein